MRRDVGAVLVDGVDRGTRPEELQGDDERSDQPRSAYLASKLRPLSRVSRVFHRFHHGAPTAIASLR